MLKTEKKIINVSGRQIEVGLTPIDQLVNWFSPKYGNRRLKSRMFEALSGAYIGAQYGRRGTKQWITSSDDPDADILYDLPTLRARSRDLIRNAPIATGAIGTSVANVVGTGLKLQSRIDYEYLGMTEDEADAWQDNVEREWRLFAESQECDIARTLNFAGIQNLAFRQTLENGDVFCLTPRLKRGNFPYSLKLQLIEADRVCNESRAADKAGLIAGIEKDETTGAPIRYHVMNQHPESAYVMPKDGYQWQIIPAFGELTGIRNVIHLYEMLRPGQTRGVPFIAPVIEPLKVLDRYTEAELMAAAVSALFTVFLKTETGDLDFDVTSGMGAELDRSTSDDDLKMGSGSIVGLKPGYDIEVADPKRPNAAFEPFVTAILIQIGAALGIPYEVLTRHFNSSYSASRAALLEAWRFFKGRRQWLASMFCQPVYDIFLYEAVAIGRIPALGFFADPLIRKAYSKAVWIGDSPSYIDPEKDIGAARERIELNISTWDQETAQMTGGDFEENIRQLSKEKRMMEKSGLWPPPALEKKQSPTIQEINDKFQQVIKKEKEEKYEDA